LSEININTENSLVVRELITRFRVKDVMSTTLRTAKGTDPLRVLQKQMKDNRISGIPVVDDQMHLEGITTVDDIISALDGGYINEKCEDHMTSNPIVLEQHLPLTVAVSYFEKYSFRRFPVVDHENRLVGIISGRDILSKLLYEINSEVDKLEELLPEDSIKSSEFFYRKFKVDAKDMENAGNGSGDIKKFCTRSGFGRKLSRRVGIAAFELEINIAVHSEGGSLTVVRDEHSLQIIAQDRGPGIEDVEAAMTEGFSTANEWVRSYGFGAGMGLPNIKRVCDQFHISSDKDHGTMVTATFNLDPSV
jgi:CBS domain-containing protein